MLFIMIEFRQVYGNVLAYPVCDQAKRFAKIANTKTLTRNTLSNVLAMGLTIIELRHGVRVSEYTARSECRMPVVA